MPQNASAVSMIVGGCLVLGPMVYWYLYTRLAMQVQTSMRLQQFTFSNGLPDYYSGWCLFLGIVMMGIGVVLAFRDKRVNISQPKQETFAETHDEIAEI